MHALKWAGEILSLFILLCHRNKTFMNVRRRVRCFQLVMNYLFRHYIESKTPSWRRRKDTPTECTNNLCPFSIQRATIDKIPFVRGEHLLKGHLPTTLTRTKKSFAPLSTARIVVNGTFLRGNVAFKEEVCHVYGCHGWCDVPIADVLSVTRQFISTRNNHGGSSRGQKPLPITGQGWWRSVFE